MLTETVVPHVSLLREGVASGVSISHVFRCFALCPYLARACVRIVSHPFPPPRRYLCTFLQSLEKFSHEAERNVVASASRLPSNRSDMSTCTWRYFSRLNEARGGCREFSLVRRRERDGASKTALLHVCPFGCPSRGRNLLSVGHSGDYVNLSVAIFECSILRGPSTLRREIVLTLVVLISLHDYCSLSEEAPTNVFGWVGSWVAAVVAKRAGRGSLLLRSVPQQFRD